MKQEFLMWNENFDVFCYNLLPTKVVLIAGLNFSIIHWSLSKIGHRNTSTCSELNPVQNSRSKLEIDDLSKKCESALIPIKQYSAFRWLVQKLGNYLWHNSELIAILSLQPNLSKMKCNVWTQCRNLHWWGKLQFSDKRYLGNLLLKTIIQSVTDQSLISWTLRSVLNFEFSILNFLWSMSCSMSIQQNLCQVKIFQLQSMSNAIIFIDRRFAVKNSVISCLALIFN